MHRKKAPGHDGVLTEMLVAADDYGLKELTMLTNMVYTHGYFPKYLNKSIFITLSKALCLTRESVMLYLCKEECQREQLRSKRTYYMHVSWISIKQGVR